MADYTIGLSGPAGTVREARRLLAEAGLTVLDTDYDHGMRDPGGADRDAAFVTVEDDDIDRPTKVLEPLGWRLRISKGAPFGPAIPLGQILADQQSWN